MSVLIGPQLTEEERAAAEERRRVRRRRQARLAAAALGRGQAGDSPQFTAVLAAVKVRVPVGRPRTRPDAVAADKACSSRANRAHLRRRCIKAVIPEKADQAAST